MKNNINNYHDLSKEEERLKKEIRDAERKIDDAFEVNISPQNISEYIKSFIPFTFGDKSLDKNTSRIENTSQEKDGFIDLTIDLAYESLALLLFKKSTKKYEDSPFKSIPVILKSLTDKLYYQNKVMIKGICMAILEKTKEKATNSKQSDQEE